MTVPQIDYAAVYRQLPIPVVLLTPEFAIADVNLASERATGRARDELLGRNVFDAFPNNPADPAATTVRNTVASLRRVLDTGEPYAVEFQRSDIEVPGSPGEFARYYWSGVNAPVVGPDGRVALIAIMAEDVTDRMHRFMSALARTRCTKTLDSCQESRPARRAVAGSVPAAWHDGQRHDATADPDRSASGRRRPGRSVRGVRPLDCGPGAQPVPAPGRGAHRDRLRRQRDPVHAHRVRQEPGRDGRALRRAGRGTTARFYTAPIKALVSEKFFALCDIFGADDVGMMTGDASVNPTAPIICCTAEILANIALRDGAAADVGQVVMDEFHYLRRPRSRLGLAGAAARAAAGAVRPDVRDARRRQQVRART